MVDKQSFAFLSLHKAGSAFAVETLRGIFLANGWTSCDFASEAFDLGVDEYDYMAANIDALSRTGVFFGPLRGDTTMFVSRFPSLTPIVHIRDPRDCLVSNYYSICFSHVLPGPGPEREKFVKWRNFYRQLSVDEFCLDVLTKDSRSFSLLRSVAETKPQSIISRYEEMVTDFPGWIRDLGRKIPMKMEDDVVGDLDAKNQSPLHEDIYSHKRQVTPGDFRRKLSRAVQIRLTDFFRDDLIYFGYSVDV